MEEFKSKVYIQIDEKNRVLRCEGGYTMANIKNIEEWIFIDEGTGDKYNLCQSHYFEKGLTDEKGCHNYIYENEEAREATKEEKEAEEKEFPQPEPEPTPTEEDVWAELDKAYQEGVNSI